MRIYPESDAAVLWGLRPSKAHISFKVIPACPNIVVGFLFAPLINRPTDLSAFEDSSTRAEKKPIYTGTIISPTELRPA
jgi:hypothetical protein